jgi:hypothetical protein
MEVVIARHNEPAAWVAGTLPPGCLVTVYDKGASPPADLGPEAFPAGCDVVSLPNVGREAHTYLHHIVTHYDDLDDHVVFLQGHPFDHCPDLAAELRDFAGSPSDFRYFASWMLTDCTCRTAPPAHPWVRMRETYEAVFGHPAPDTSVRFGAGAQFAASREAIRRRPLEFYRAALHALATVDTAAYAMERMWPLVFT